ncbi:MAG: hypothetical protein NC548_66090 [Lachnospiraceae bacterium]|nr:hypothetical protein [Lachnospiraceae bacterium]
MQTQNDSKLENPNENLELVIPKVAHTMDLTEEEYQELLAQITAESEIHSPLLEPDAYDAEGKPLYSDFVNERDIT